MLTIRMTSLKCNLKSNFYKFINYEILLHKNDLRTQEWIHDNFAAWKFLGFGGLNRHTAMFIMILKGKIIKVVYFLPWQLLASVVSSSYPELHRHSYFPGKLTQYPLKRSHGLLSWHSFISTCVLLYRKEKKRFYSFICYIMIIS